MNIEWSPIAVRQLDKALDFLFENGFYSYALQVEENILSHVGHLADHSLIYPADKYKIRNDGSYRAFEVNEYRVSYRISEKVIKVLRVRHTSRKPRKY